jgi:hypothetical protein
MRKSIVLTAVSVASLGATTLIGSPASAGVLTIRSGGQTLVAAPHGTGTSCTRSSPCGIRTAVHKAGDGDTVVVTRGTYHASGLTITHRVRVVGQGRPVIDATVGTPTQVNARGLIVKGAGAAGTRISGLVVTNATEEGILAQSTHDITITGNVVQGNDRGLTAQKFDECAPAGPVPGDCGEGLHLMSVTGSLVKDNLVRRNAGGILLTDELGPTARNVIAGNRVLDNIPDCGITIAGHNPNAVSATTGRRQPAMAGIYNNLVIGNVSNRNGGTGEGAGILMAGGAPFSGVYGNWIVRNAASGNGLSGITVHQHFPGDLNDNVLVGNRLGTNNLVGDRDFTPADTQTTGILVAAGGFPGTPASAPPAGPIKGTVIAQNSISHNHFGIWTLNTRATIFGNHFHDVAVPVARH